MGSARVGEDVVQSEIGDAMEMADVTGNELKVVIDGCGCDLQVGVGEDVAALFQLGADHPEDASSREIERKDRDGGKDTFLDIDQVALLGSRAERTLEEFTDGHCTGELGISRDCLQPLDIGLKGTGTQ